MGLGSKMMIVVFRSWPSCTCVGVDSPGPAGFVWCSQDKVCMPWRTCVVSQKRFNAPKGCGVQRK